MRTRFPQTADRGSPGASRGRRPRCTAGLAAAAVVAALAIPVSVAAVGGATEAAADDGVQTLVVHDFEDGTVGGWTGRAGTEVLSNSTASAHGGTHSLLTTGRTAAWNGPQVSMLALMDKGVSYSISAWVRMADGASATTAKLSMERRTAGTASYENVTSAVPVTSSTWTQLTGTWTLGTDVDFLALYAETADTGSFLLDDVQVTYQGTLPVQTDKPSLKDVYAPFWEHTGAAVVPADLLGDYATLLRKHFNSITPGNAMKWDAIERAKGNPTYTEADTMVATARSLGIDVYGHVLAWHNQLPAWVFQDDSGNDLPVDAASKQIVLDRLTAHIQEIVGRYKGQVYAWDVANEVIDDADGVTYRNSKWYQYTGLDFIRTAFRVAHDADPAAELCINDYNTQWSGKRQKYFALVQQLLAEGVPVTCVGHQLHVNIDQSISDVDTTLSLFETLGLPQRITELDVSVYTNSSTVYTTIPEASLTKQQAVYTGLFQTFVKHAPALASVTLWGLTDDRSWLQTWPITRLDAPLLFDSRLQAKPVFDAVAAVGQGTSPTSTTPAEPTPTPTTPTATTPPTTASPGSATCTAAVRAVSSWPGGFQGEVTVTAGSVPLTGWSVSWPLASGQAITNVWNGTLAVSGGVATVRNASYNGVVSAGSTTTFGFIAGGTPSTPTATCAAT